MMEMSIEEQAGMEGVSGTCMYCMQMKTVWVSDPSKYSQEDIDRIASSECGCPGAQKEGKKQQLMNSGLDAIRMALTNQHQKNAAKVMTAGLEDICTGRIKKVSVQIDKEKTASMFLAKVEVDGGGKDIRVIVDLKETVYSWSDGEQGPDNE